MTCGAYRPSRGDHLCTEPAKFEVVYFTRDRSKVVDRVSACFAHGMAEVDRHYRAGGIAPVELRSAAAA